MNYSKIILKKDKDKSLRRFHPWVFSGAIQQVEGELEEGDVVEVYAQNGKYLGTGHYQIGSISVRVFEFEQQEITIDYWRAKLTTAIELRESLGLLNSTETTIFRLVHAGGDYLPGLIIDFYNGTAVLQCHSIGMWKLSFVFSNILKDLLGDKLVAVYDKSSETLPFKAGLDPKNEYIFGAEDAVKKGIEYKNEFAIDWETGQKTGFFIDQRENRKLLAQYAQGKKVLNTYCYSGGFSIYALNQGASLVHSVDSSQKAIDLVENNVKLIPSLAEKHQSFVSDSLEYITATDTQYDVIILDPPAFGKHKRVRHKAVQGYKRLNAKAMKKIQPGGIIFTFSCSQIVDKELFANTIAAAAIEARRKVRVLHQLHQPADHPVNLAQPESEYLKGLVIQVL
ncbi:MAG: class I SAM-dependent rRNA methyltransferase [Flavobacteriales bacterium]|jgi:23S rRNA (cytosine1962-C5)-methyltransferase|nr:class I SAM-dependent rRNA methyltransferase [Flavobacteriales bacterium]